jgi:FG-GAP-like repeat/Putative Ig domain
VRHISTWALVFAAFSAVILAIGCGGSSSAPASVSVSLSAAATQTDQGQTVNVTATVTNGSSNQGVTWVLTGPGSLSAQASGSVTYNAPASVPNAQNAAITATSVANSSATASVQITVNPAPQISSQVFVNGTTGSAYNQSIASAGGTAPFAWSVSSGALPTGLSLGSSTGAITGTPTGGGTWNFTLELTDSIGLTSLDDVAITINSNAAAGNPVPFVNQPLVPSSTAPGGSAFTLTVNGSGFISGATVNFNGTALTTTFVSGSQLTASVPAASIASAGTASITVTNPTPGGGRSNVVYFPIAASEATISFANASGSPVAAPYSAYAAVVADFNGDSKPDLAVEGVFSLAILLGNGDGTFSAASGSPINLISPSQASDPIASGLVLGDFNNDGKIDLAVLDSGYSTDNVPLFLGNGDGTFTPSSAPGTTNAMTGCSIAPADFNHDGNLDLAVGNGIYGGVSILLGYGDAAFNLVSPPSTPAPVFTGCSVAVGDFNGDGILDMAIPDSTDNTVTIFLGDGDGTFTQATGSPISISGGPSAIAVGDFNGDGKLDLAITNGSTNTVTILLGNGDGTFTQATGSPIAVGNTPDAIVAADFLNNGKLDLAVANFTDNTVTLLLGNGDGTFTPSSNSPIAVGNGPTSLAVGDFNGDGRLDLVVTNQTDGTVSILIQQ